MGEVAQAMLRLLERDAARPVEHDPMWLSPAEVLPPDTDGMVTGGGRCRWPRQRRFPGMPLHPGLRELYGTFWGGTTGGGRHSGESVLIRVPWNPADLVRLRNSSCGNRSGRASPLLWPGPTQTGTSGRTHRPPIQGEVAPSVAAFLAEVE